MMHLKITKKEKQKTALYTILQPNQSLFFLDVFVLSHGILTSQNLISTWLVNIIKAHFSL